MERYHVIVVGGGPAGLTAAIYASRAGKSVLLLEAQGCGGQIAQSARIENYPGIPEVSGWELAERMEEQARREGTAFVFDRVTGVEAIRDGNRFRVMTASGKTFTGDYVILAVGLQCRKLGIPGEERFTGRGISWCATCDGAFFRGKDVAVVGGGNTALHEAMELAGVCRKVWLIHRDVSFQAQEAMITDLRRYPNVESVPHTVVLSVNGESALTSLTLSDVQSGETRELPVSGLFEAIGRIPQNNPFSSLVKTDEEGYLCTDADCRTSVPGIYAVGDCRSKEIRQLTTAVSDGTVAGTRVSMPESFSTDRDAELLFR